MPISEAPAVEHSRFRETNASSRRLLLFIFLLLALVLRIGANVRSHHIAHPDEIFQTQEPAHRLAYGYGVITWEWRLGIRSWIFPAFLALVMRTTDSLGAGSAGYELGITTVLATISLTTVWFGFAWSKRENEMQAAIIAAGICAIWYELVIFSTRALTEVVAAHVLLPGLYLGAFAEGSREKQRLFLAGVICGLAMALRIQLAPTVIFAVLYFCRFHWRRRIPVAIAGLLVPVVVFGIVDALTWSHPFQSFTRYFWVNLIEKRSEQYGTAPWYFYIPVLLGHMGPLVFAALTGARRSILLTGTALSILLSHSLVAHKEVRFIYPMMPIVITLAALGIMDLKRNFGIISNSLTESRFVVPVTLVFVTILSAMLASQFSYWLKDDGSLAAFDQLSRDSTVCGVGLYRIPWFDSGGYSHLHRDIPIIIVEDHDLSKGNPAFNVLVAPRFDTDNKIPLHFDECWGEVCLYRRMGPCSPVQHNDVNEVLKRTGN